MDTQHLQSIHRHEFITRNCNHRNHYSDLNASAATCRINTMSEHRDNVIKHPPFSSVMPPSSRLDQPFRRTRHLDCSSPRLKGPTSNCFTCTGLVLVPVKPPELHFCQRTTACHRRLHLTCHNALLKRSIRTILINPSLTWDSPIRNFNNFVLSSDK